MNILEKIIEHKKIEVAVAAAAVPIAVMEKKPFFSRPCLSLKEFLLNPQRTGIIAEFKRKSPSKGIINANADLLSITAAYNQHGASGLSILTDETFFGGSSQDLENARVHEIPILRKEFIIDPYQVVEAKAMGADVILLIAACLTPRQVKDLAVLAKILQLEVLLEVHDETELDHVCNEVDIVGVNNRDLKTFVVDINRSAILAGKIPAGMTRISESGIKEIADIHFLKKVGFDGFLVGENFMKAADPAIAFASFANQLTNTAMKI